MSTYRPSADRAEYAAQSDEERRRTRDAQKRSDGSFYGGTRPAGPPPVQIVDRDITQWRQSLEYRDAQATEEGPVGVMGAEGAAGTDIESARSGVMPSSVDIDAAWSDRRWVLYDEARQEAEGPDLGEGEVNEWIYQHRLGRNFGVDRLQGINNALQRESIEDWKARMKRAEEYGTSATMGQVTQDSGIPGAPVAEDEQTKYFQFTDPATGMVRTVRIDGVNKSESTPDAAMLADSLLANGQKDMVFLGWEGDYAAGQSRVTPMLATKESLRYFDNFPPEMQDRVMEITLAYYEGMSPQFSWNEKRWNEAVNIAQNALYSHGVYKTPFEAYEESLIRWRAKKEEQKRTSRGGGGGYGGGYGGSASTKRITLTNPTDAYYLLNQAMSQFLGRQATSKELSEFVKLLNAQERANPTVATMDGDTTTQEGGFNPATFAEQFARSQEGSAEFQAATTFMDALLGAMNAETGVL